MPNRNYNQQVKFKKTTKRSAIRIMRNNQVVPYYTPDLVSDFDSANTVSLGTTSASVTPAASSPALDCVTTNCRTIARDATVQGAAGPRWAFTLPYKKADLKPRTIVFDVYRATAVTITQVNVTLTDGATFVNTEVYADAVTTLPAGVTRFKIDLSQLPTATTGTGWGATNNSRLLIALNGTGIVPVQLLGVYIAESLTSLECKKAIDFACLTTYNVENQLEVIRERCGSNSYSSEPVDANITAEVQTLDKNWRLLDPRYTYKTSLVTTTPFVTTATVTTITTRGRTYGSIDLSAANLADCSNVQITITDPNCGKVTLGKLCDGDFGQVIPLGYFTITSAGTNNPSIALMDASYIGQVVTVEYQKTVTKNQWVQSATPTGATYSAEIFLEYENGKVELVYLPVLLGLGVPEGLSNETQTFTLTMAIGEDAQGNMQYVTELN